MADSENQEAVEAGEQGTTGGDRPGTGDQRIAEVGFHHVGFLSWMHFNAFQVRDVGGVRLVQFVLDDGGRDLAVLTCSISLGDLEKNRERIMAYVGAVDHLAEPVTMRSSFSETAQVYAVHFVHAARVDSDAEISLYAFSKGALIQATRGKVEPCRVETQPVVCASSKLSVHVGCLMALFEPTGGNSK